MANIGRNLLDLAVLGLPLDEQKRSARLFMRMTGEEIQSAFRKWVRPDGFVQVVLGPGSK
jgi:zinc protease